MSDLLTMFGAQVDLNPLQVPTHCPECGHPVKWEGEFLVCPNSRRCPAQIAGAIKIWIKKLGILDWGDSLIEALCAEGLVEEIPDLYSLTKEQIATLELSGRRVGGSTAERVLKNLHDKKNLSLSAFIGSLNIPMIARSMTKTIVMAGFDTLEKMADASIEDISDIDGVGQVKAESFVDGLQGRIPLIQRLLKAGIEIKGPAEGPLKGKNICMTGFRDPEMAEAIEDAGGAVKSGVSRKVHYLVAQDVQSTSGKAKKARSYDIPILSIEGMWRMLRDG